MAYFRHPHALKNSFAGVVAEARAATEFIKCGLRVAKPCWTDNECDLIVLSDVDGFQISTIVQVKAVQFLASRTRPTTKPRFIAGLKKRYIENNPALCIMIYRPDKDKLWFIDGPENIRRVYSEDQAAAKRKSYRSLNMEEDVRIRVEAQDCRLDNEWLVPNDRQWLKDRVDRIAGKTLQKHDQEVRIRHAFDAETSGEDGNISFD